MTSLPSNIQPRITEEMWKKWHKDNPERALSAEETILWLDGMRQVMFELWAKNPNLNQQNTVTQNQKID